MSSRRNAQRTGRPRETRRRALNVLITCAGRRVELVNAFRNAATELDVDICMHGADMSWFSPAMHHVDHAHIVPALSDDTHIEALLEIAREGAVDVMIPTIDSELLLLSRAWDRFDAVGTRLVISSEHIIQICQDKLLTFEMLRTNGIDTPDTWTCEAVLRKKKHTFPYFLKPREGSAGAGNYKVESLDELDVLRRRVHDPIVQEFVEGVEHTLDVYTGFDGIPRCVVPRKRLEVRSGEVSKGVIVKDGRIMAAGRDVALALGDCRGVITVQCIVTPRGRIRVIEINPRFGGGAPLAIHAGANFPKWLIAEHLGRPMTIKPTDFEGELAMLRYDESVFCSVHEPG